MNPIDRDRKPTQSQGEGARENEAWQESDSRLFQEFGRIFTPGREEMERAFLDLIPAERDEPFVAVDVGTGAGWLAEAVLNHFPRSRLTGLDGSLEMLTSARERLTTFSGRMELREFSLQSPEWPTECGDEIRCFLSSLVIHHLDGKEKRQLFRRLHESLQKGGALLIGDIVAPTSERARRHMAEAWDEEVRRRSLDLTGEPRAFHQFIESEWNLFRHPDDSVDKPSTLPEQLSWLGGAGFTGVDIFWAKAGHALFGGYKA